MPQPAKLDLRSPAITEDIRQAILRLAPSARTEGGKIDFELLKLLLGEAVDVGKERYSLSWPGKADALRLLQTPSLGTLRPQLKESLSFATTQHVLIEGDNLQVLKLLQKSYLGAVKMIYIDPPYNTGGDFIYPDDYSESLQTYLRYTGQADLDGRSFGTNPESDGRFHSRWLTMMYPRLFLARNLLKDDGVVFISIDDHEVHNLRRICDEVFGEENFVCTFVWEKRYSPPPDTKEVGYVHENILLYRKSSQFAMGLLPLSVDQVGRYKNPDHDERGPWKPMDYTCRYTKSERPNLYYRILNPHTKKWVWPKDTRVWAFSSEVHKKNEQEKRIWWGEGGRAKVPALKNFLSDIKQGMMPMTLLKHEAVGNTDEATKELREDIPDLKYTPKPIRLVRHLAVIANVSKSDVVLDCFAGSGTTALAVLALNQEDGGKRRFVLVQLPEPTGRKDLATMADIMRERVRRRATRRKTVAGSDGPMRTEDREDLGFRAFRLDESNFTTWDATASGDAEELADQLRLHVDHVRDGRSENDLLFELLLKSGFPLSTAIETLKLVGTTVYSVASGALLLCLEKSLTLEVIRAMAELKPERVVCLDLGFAGADQLKANAMQIFRTKGVTSFKTV